ncbi:hypothetical protein APHAL10511_001417 [Amanita phalloides]|nr:hypothetical protein APHAL10511_001417 [Amanita phalloides]
MPKNTEAMIMLMGATGTGKSTFIRLLTNDENIRIGHDLESMTFDVATSHYIDRGARLRVTLVDTPGFDDSREGVSDTDILGKIANFLQDSGGRKLNGIIYLHRISDPRFSGTAKKNLRIFRELCGDDKLDHVRFVTTYWNVVSEKEGKDRESALANGVFKPFIDAGAKLIRHDGRFEFAKKIVSDLARKTPVKVKIQEELNAGMALGDTSAGAVIVEDMKELQKKHEDEMEELKKEFEEAENENDEYLRVELDEERRKLEEKIAQVEEDRKRLATMRLNLDERSQQDVGDLGRAVPAKREKALGEPGQGPQKDKGQSGEQRDSYRKSEQRGGGNRTTAEVGGEQTKPDIPSPPKPPVQDPSQETCAKPENIQEGIQKGKAPDGDEGNNQHRESLGGSELPATAQDAIAGEKRWERKEEITHSRRSPVHNRSQDMENANGEWVVYCIFMISLVAVVFAVTQSE